MSTSGGADRQPPRDEYRGMPTWVKWFMVAAVVAATLLLLGGEHGPGRHVSSPAAHESSAQASP